MQENKASQQITPNRPDLIRMRTGSEAEIAEKKEKKQKFSVSLSRLEIEEDVFALTRSKPAKRPKKREKIVQQQHDVINFGSLNLQLFLLKLFVSFLYL